MSMSLARTTSSVMVVMNRTLDGGRLGFIGQTPDHWLFDHEAVPHREEARASAIPDAGLGVDVFCVAACGSARDCQLLCNVSVGESACEQPRHFDLSRGQPSGEFAAPPGAMAGGLQ